MSWLLVFALLDVSVALTLIQPAGYGPIVPSPWVVVVYGLKAISVITFAMWQGVYRDTVSYTPSVYWAALVAFFVAHVWLSCLVLESLGG